jgi:flagellar hook-associated protein 3 FlgL
MQGYVAGGNDEQQMVVVGNGLTQPANITIGKELADALNLIDKAITVLKQPDASANDADSRAVLTAALEGMDTAMDQVSTKISKLGGAQNIIATLNNNWSNLSIANQTAVLDYSSMDYTKGAVELNSLMTAIQATQSAYGKVSKLSLFDAL